MSRVSPYTSFVLYHFLRALLQIRVRSSLLHLLINTGYTVYVTFDSFPICLSSHKKMEGYAIGKARLLILLPMGTRQVARGNTVILRPKIVSPNLPLSYSTDSRSKWNYPAKTTKERSSKRANESVGQCTEQCLTSVSHFPRLFTTQLYAEKASCQIEFHSKHLEGF